MVDQENAKETQICGRIKKQPVSQINSKMHISSFLFNFQGSKGLRPLICTCHEAFKRFGIWFSLLQFPGFWLCPPAPVKSCFIFITPHASMMFLCPCRCSRTEAQPTDGAEPPAGGGGTSWGAVRGRTTQKLLCFQRQTAFLSLCGGELWRSEPTHFRGFGSLKPICMPHGCHNMLATDMHLTCNRHATCNQPSADMQLTSSKHETKMHVKYSWHAAGIQQTCNQHATNMQPKYRWHASDM